MKAHKEIMIDKVVPVTDQEDNKTRKNTLSLILGVILFACGMLALILFGLTNVRY